MSNVIPFRGKTKQEGYYYDPNSNQVVHITANNDAVFEKYISAVANEWDMWNLFHGEES